MKTSKLPAKANSTGTPALSIGNAENDWNVVQLWTHGRPKHTQRAYHQDARRFIESVQKPLQIVTLEDLQRFADSLAELSPNSQRRTLAAVKSLFTFAHRIGYLQLNPAAAVRSPKVKNTLAERILTEEEVLLMITLETDPRNRALVRLAYSTGGRVSAICGLAWRDVQARANGAGQVTLFTKGGKTLFILVSAATWSTLLELRKDSDGVDDPIFRSQDKAHRSTNGGHLDPAQVWRIIRAAAKRAGIEKPVSPHWLRHAHASHALDRGAPLALVQATLGHASIQTTGQYLHARPDDSSSRYLGV